MFLQNCSFQVSRSTKFTRIFSSFSPISVFRAFPGSSGDPSPRLWPEFTLSAAEGLSMTGSGTYRHLSRRLAEQLGRKPQRAFEAAVAPQQPQLLGEQLGLVHALKA